MLVPTDLSKKERAAYDKANAQHLSRKVPKAGRKHPGLRVSGAEVEQKVKENREAAADVLFQANAALDELAILSAAAETAVTDAPDKDAKKNAQAALEAVNDKYNEAVDVVNVAEETLAALGEA